MANQRARGQGMNPAPEAHFRSKVNIRLCERSAADRVASGLRDRGYLAGLAQGKRSVLYRPPDGPIGAVVLRPYSILWGVWRFHVDHYFVSTVTRALTKLGLSAEERRYLRDGIDFGSAKLEVSFLPEELDAFTDWIPSWMTARDAGAPLPIAPCPMTTEPPVVDYAWSAAAAVRAAEWRARLERLRASHERTRP